jgi:5,6,7,8-tetrahydromethanopterin hydro-lyase
VGARTGGVAGGVADALAEQVIDPARVGELLLLAAVWVDWEAAEAERVYANNRAATLAALRAGAAGGPTVAAVLAGRADPANPFFSPRR